MSLMVQILGRVPFLRDRLPFPVRREDGQYTTLTAREALQIEQGWQATCRRSRIDSNANQGIGFLKVLKRLLSQALYP